MRRSVKLSPELKQAISGMSPKEKDKLLYRLIAKDAKLAEQLQFKLLENATEARVEDRRLAVQQKIDLYFKRYDFYSPGYLLLDLRDLSGVINRHVAVTKDRYGEIYLNFYMLNMAFDHHGLAIQQFQPHKSRTFHEYVIKRASKLLKLLEKLHEDYRLDFEEAMQQLGQHMSADPVLFQRLPAFDFRIKDLLNP